MYIWSSFWYLLLSIHFIFRSGHHDFDIVGKSSLWRSEKVLHVIINSNTMHCDVTAYRTSVCHLHPITCESFYAMKLHEYVVTSLYSTSVASVGTHIVRSLHTERSEGPAELAPNVSEAKNIAPKARYWKKNKQPLRIEIDVRQKLTKRKWLATSGKDCS